MLTAATTSPTPKALVQPNRSPKTVAPMATAVSRFQRPENRRERRPDEFDRPDQRDVGDRRGRERQSENSEPLFSVGHEPDTAREHPSAEKQQSSEGHDVKGQGGRFDLRRAALAYADDIAGIGEYRNGGRNGPRRGISAPAADSSGGEEGDTGQRNADGRAVRHEIRSRKKSAMARATASGYMKWMIEATPLEIF